MVRNPTFTLPFSPRHVLVGAGDHARLVAAIHAARPELQLRGAPHTECSEADLDWADCYVGFKPPRRADTMGAVRWVHCTGAGVDAWLNGPALHESILLTRTSESFGPAIAEWVLSRMLAFQQRLRVLDEAQRAGQWIAGDPQRLAGTRALVLGTGDIGSAIARVLQGLGVRATGISRSGTAAEPAFAAVHTVASLAELVPTADWLVLALPATAASRRVVSRDILARCRGAVLLNVGRGAVVDESAIPEALDAGWLRGAALDVFEVEPLPASSPLWRDARVMVSPHCSGPTTVEGAVTGFLGCLDALAAGELPRWQVDRLAGY